MAIEQHKQRFIPSGRMELDRRLGGGLPIPSLIMMEGQNSTGKSTFLQQMMWGGLEKDLKITYITTECQVKTLLGQMKQISLDVEKHFLWGRLKIIPLHLEGMKWNDKILSNLLNDLLKFINHDPNPVIVVDSITYFLYRAVDEDMLTFFTNLRNLVEKGKSILFSLHPEPIDPNMLIKIRAICDGHILLKLSSMGGRFVRIAEVVKLKGSEITAGTIFSFDVDPVFGVRVVPISIAKP